MNLLMASNIDVAGDLSASISPPKVSVTTSNGAYTSPYYTVSYFNAVGSVDISWEVSGDIGPASIVGDANGERIRVSAFGNNNTAFIVVKCSVKDDNGEATAGASLNINFGNGNIR